MEKMSITKALVELKLLEKRINDRTASTVFIGVVKGKKDITTSLLRKDDLEKSAKSDLQSIQDLIERRKKIKAAIVISNANTIVEIDRIKYSVAEAIERKNSIVYEFELLNKMKEQLARAETEVTRENSKMENSLDNLLGQQLTTEKKKNEDVEQFVKTYKDMNEAKLFDPIDIRAKIKEYENSIDQFEANVDFTLSEANATSFIELEFSK